MPYSFPICTDMDGECIHVEGKHINHPTPLSGYHDFYVNSVVN